MNSFKKASLILLMACITVFTSCSSDDDSGSLDLIFLRAKVDGVAYNSDPLKTNAVFHIMHDGTPVLSLAGEDGQGGNIMISVNKFNSIGTYDIGDDFTRNVGVASYWEDGMIWGTSEIDDGPIGKLVITEYKENRKVSGTFHFSVQQLGEGPIRNITDGEFSMMVQTISR